MILKVLLYLAAVIVACLSDIPPACKSKIDIRNIPNYFSIHDTPLVSKTFFVNILESSEQDCSINLTELVPQMKLPPFPVLQVIGIQCTERNRIFVTEYSGYADHIVFHVELVLCSLNLKSLNNILNIGDTRVLIASGKVESENETFDSNQKDGLKNLVTFVYDNRGGSKHQSISNVFDVNSSYTNLVEIIIKNITLDINPDEMLKIFPNLQSLEIPNNGLTLPPSLFPWTDNSVYLPRNLSRSPLFQSHYSTVDYINIQSNIFRRYLNLEGNEIKNLSGFEFHGRIDKISLKGNGLLSIGNMTFGNVTGLQNVDLSNNLLRSVPRDLFKGQSSLQKIELGGNIISTLPNGIFEGLTSLRYLGLANNSLTELPEGIFKPLQNIEIFRLEHNKLVKVNPNSFSLGAVNLKEIHFQFNPITELPHFPFYMRKLKLVNFHATNISFGNFTEFLEGFVAFQLFGTVVDTASDSDMSDLLQRDEVLRKVDLSNCNITNIQLTENLSHEICKVLVVLLLHYEFDFKNNPLICDCKINSFVDLLNAYAENGTISKSDYYFNEWNCQSPSELNGHRLLSVKQEETYCKVTVHDCPSECLCYMRSKVEHIIVDCRGVGLNTFHKTLPDGILELWYSGNNITNIDNVPFPERIIEFDISDNKLEYMNPDVIGRMTSLKILHVHSNVLAYIPKEITYLNLKSVTIFPNPLTCDCHTLWLKNWIGEKKHVIKDWYKVACKVENEDGMVMLEVPDDKFKCNEKFDQLMNVVLPSVTSSVATLLLVIVLAIVYAYRLECKVLMFVYLGVHPFDKDSEKDGEHLDCVIVHSGMQTDWVMEKIVALLEDENYHFLVCDMARDFVVGYSFHENLTRTVKHSKRMIVCLSDEWQTTSDSFTTAWQIAQEKIRATRPHYGIIVSHEIDKSNIQDKDLNRFIKHGRFIDSKDKFFGNKILYYMPQVVKTSAIPDTRNSQIRKSDLPVSGCFINSVCEETVQSVSGQDFKAFVDPMLTSQVIDACPQSHAFISYHKEDFQYVLNDLLPLLEEKGFSYCISDRDFVPGASIEENILNAINKNHRTIFILSPVHIQDEWSLFTFRAAYEKVLREKSNHLLVIIKEEVDTNELDEEIRHYLNNYISLDINDRWFQKKLFNGMPLLKDHEDLHSSPLFVRCFSVDEKDISIEVN